MRETGNCPHCGRTHELGEYGPRPELKKNNRAGIPCAPPDVQCECGATLRMCVPVFKANATGWYWKRVDAPARNPIAPTHDLGGEG